MSSKLTPAEPSSEDLCRVMSAIAGNEVTTVADMARFSHQVGIEVSDFFQTARMIAVIETALQAGGK